jgi:SAM-dependent methyltransferase
MNRLDEEVIGWDVLNWKCAVEFWQAYLPADLSGTRSLEIGCGGGGLSLWLALKNSYVVCSDYREPPPHTQALHRDWRVSDHVCYQTIDATNIPYEGEFDIVILKSVLCSVGRLNRLDRVQQALEEIHKSLKPGGKLLFAENLDPPIHRFFRRSFVPWGKDCRYFKRDELLTSLSMFRKTEFGTAGFLGAFGRNERQRRILGTVDRLFLSRMVGWKLHYLMFGVAQK